MMLHWNQTLYTLHWPLNSDGRFAGAADAGDIGDLWRFDSERRALEASGAPMTRRDGRGRGAAAIGKVVRAVVICAALAATAMGVLHHKSDFAFRNSTVFRALLNGHVTDKDMKSCAI